jgi:hypothetical protein
MDIFPTTGTLIIAIHSISLGISPQAHPNLCKAGSFSSFNSHSEYLFLVFTFLDQSVNYFSPSLCPVVILGIGFNSI